MHPARNVTAYILAFAPQGIILSLDTGTIIIWRLPQAPYYPLTQVLSAVCVFAYILLSSLPFERFF